MSENTEVLKRIEKLLALADSTQFEGERSAAWDSINRLLTQHRLDLSDVQGKRTEVINYQIDLSKYTPVRRWRLGLLAAISIYLPITVLHAGHIAWIYCKPSELELALFLYQSISNQLQKAAKQACRNVSIEGNPQKWRARFNFAAVEVISRRFNMMRWEQEQMLARANQGEKALIVIRQDKAEIDAHIQAVVKPGKGREFRETLNDELAQELGERAGQRANLNPGLTA